MAKKPNHDFRFMEREQLLAFFLENEEGQNDEFIAVLKAVHLLTPYNRKPTILSAGAIAKGLTKRFKIQATGYQIWRLKGYIRSVLDGMKQTVKYT